ncbi:hypothetical protein FPV67DRAFT_1672868 [Lyophyllum atratum]|nr:hypothetical protein FPV67DRAFT_1672868 [Lyophyllum atratum]
MQKGPPTSLDKCTVPLLRYLCKARSVTLSGKKEDLLQRLQSILENPITVLEIKAAFDALQSAPPSQPKKRKPEAPMGSAAPAKKKRGAVEDVSRLRNEEQIRHMFFRHPQ